MDEDDRPATLKDIRQSEARLEEYILKSLDALETRLLTAFHGYNERNDLRLKRIETAEASTAGRVASLEAEDRFNALELRVLKLEQKVR